MSIILVIQPDAAQGRVLQDMSRRIGAELVVVDSTKRAVETFARQVPDLILLSPFLSPRDEDTLMGRLRSLEGASHLQTMTIPQFQTAEDAKSKRSAFGFRKKQKAAVAVGADPAAFAEEVVALLSRASDIRNRPAPVGPGRSVMAPEPEPVQPAVVLIEDAPEVEPVDEPVFMNTLTGADASLDDVDTFVAAADDAGSNAREPWQDDEPAIAAVAPEHHATSGTNSSIADEIDLLVRRLGLEANLPEPVTPPAVSMPPLDVMLRATDDDEFDFAASLDRARNRALTKSEETPFVHADAEAIRETAMAEARAVAEQQARVAREASAAEIARVQAEAAAAQVAAEARVAAESQAREALAADLARTQAEAEQREALVARAAREAAEREAEFKRETAVREARAAAEREAEETRRAAIREAREAAEREAEQKREAAIREARETAERDAEQKRQAAIREAREAAEREAEQKRQAAIREAEQKREAAIREARAAAEREAEQKRVAAIAEARAAAEREGELKREAAIAEARASAEREAESKHEAALAQARATAEREAREALAADLARLQVEAEQMRQNAMAEARATAEIEAREALASEVARARSEAESTFTDQLNRVKVEAEEADRRRHEAERVSAQAQQAFARELLKVRTEVEQSLTAQLEVARAEAERMQAAEAEAVRERAAVEAQLKAELDRLKFVTTQARKSDESETKKAAQQIRQLEAELASVRAKAAEQEDNELEELRAQMAEMREAAAQHARAAAADAVAAAVAAAAPRPSAVIAQFPVRQAPMVEPDEIEEPPEQNSRDYLSLWQPKEAADVDDEDPEELDDSEDRAISAAQMRRHAKWALPVAACLIFVVNTGTIETVSKFVQPSEEEKPALVVEPLKANAPFIEMIETRVGSVKIESTPAGAEVILDGKNAGKTPISIQDVEAGVHTLQLKGQAGTLTKRITVRPNQMTLVNEAIYSGWLAIFSAIPVRVVVDGTPVNLTDDGRVMVSPGNHVVEFINEQFNYRSTEKMDVRPGETAAHTVSLPKGSVRINVPDGVTIFVDNQPIAVSPIEGLSLAIGSHEVSARHPTLGERRAQVDVKHGSLTEITLRFE